MKWIFFVLFGLNLALASIQWWDIRGSKGQEFYTEIKGSSHLVLLQEHTGQSVGQRQAPDVISSPQCELIGPLQNKLEADSLMKRLNGEGIRSSLVVQKMPKAPDYWVYVGPLDSHESRLAKLREFQSKGIDSYIIATGKLEGSVSVGAFENIDSARRMKGIMSKHGYESKLAEIEKQSEEFWLQVFEPYAVENKKKIKAIIMSVEGGLEMRQIFCKSVASEKHFP